MAANATIFKAELQVTDLDRYYASHALTLAQHPSKPRPACWCACWRLRCMPTRLGLGVV